MTDTTQRARALLWRAALLGRDVLNLEPGPLLEQASNRLRRTLKDLDFESPGWEAVARDRVGGSRPGSGNKRRIYKTSETRRDER